MEPEISAKVKVLDRLRVNGKIATLRRARKEHKCDECGLPIEPRTSYYEIVEGGSGLGRLKSPDRVHEHCIDNHLHIGGQE